LRHAVAVVGEGSFRLGVLSGGPPLSLFDMLLETARGGGGSATRCSPCGSPYWVVLLSSWMWGPSILFLLFPLFFGCFGLLMIGRVSSISSQAAIKPQSLSKENKTLKPAFNSPPHLQQTFVHSCKILARYVYNKFHQSGSQNISVYVGSN